jgi:hypothetical protein
MESAGVEARAFDPESMLTTITIVEVEARLRQMVAVGDIFAIGWEVV